MTRLRPEGYLARIDSIVGEGKEMALLVAVHKRSVLLVALHSQTLLVEFAVALHVSDDWSLECSMGRAMVLLRRCARICLLEDDTCDTHHCWALKDGRSPRGLKLTITVPSARRGSVFSREHNRGRHDVSPVNSR